MKLVEFTDPKPGERIIHTDLLDSEWPKILKFIKKNCSTSWAACAQAKGLMYRGMMGSAKSIDPLGDIFIGHPKLNRDPMNMASEVQEQIDKWFSEAGLTALRSNSIFVTGDPLVARDYGDNSVFIIFPIDSFNFTWSPKIADLWSYGTEKMGFTYNKYMWHAPNNVTGAQFTKQLGFVNNNLDKAIASKNEILISGKYLAFKTKTFEQKFLELFK